MNDQHQQLIKILSEFITSDGFHETGIPKVRCVRLSSPRPRAQTTWPASFVVVVQGQNELTLESSVYRHEGLHYVVSAVDLPVVSHVPDASPETPFLGIQVMIDPLEFNSIASQMKLDTVDNYAMDTHGLFFGYTESDLLDCLIRLGKLFRKPDDAKILGPMLVQEMFYHLLKTKDGPAIRQFTSKGTKLSAVSESIKRIKTDLTKTLDVEKLARSVHMSRTAFFSSFKQVTAMSPIQYQKKLRLLAAKNILINEEETAESAAFKVGYKSASQFSREYSRMFGNSPGQDSKRGKSIL